MQTRERSAYFKKKQASSGLWTGWLIEGVAVKEAGIHGLWQTQAQSHST